MIDLKAAAVGEFLWGYNGVSMPSPEGLLQVKASYILGQLEMERNVIDINDYS